MKDERRRKNTLNQSFPKFDIVINIEYNDIITRLKVSL